jgi:hypothetical protein
MIHRVFLLSLSAAATLQGQSATRPPTTPATVPVAIAIRASSAPKIDGELNDAAWAQATPSTQFTQSLSLIQSDAADE